MSNAVFYKDTNRKIKTAEFIYICGSKNGSSHRIVNTGEVWGNMGQLQKALCMSSEEFETQIKTQLSMKNVVLIFLLKQKYYKKLTWIWLIKV